MKADLLREKFLKFFESKKHKIVESDSLVPKDDPTVLFTPAGMNQFKREFLGFDSGFKRAASSQRCLRTGDLEKVGKTRGHHTFFEMLGNFSFGDYFKKEAIQWAWEFLTEELKIDKDKLWVSVYRDDLEAYGIWKDLIKIPENKICKLGDKSNFWPSEAKEKGPNGPCGPCSEIFFDLGENIGCGKADCDPGCDCPRFLEVWNLVFTQYNRLGGGKLEPLPNKNIDTGMGLERLAAVMQGAQSNFETDLFQPIIKEIVTCHQPAPSGVEGSPVTSQKEAVYAIADHLRAIVFTIYDGVLPSNEARGYIVRKLIRKAALHLRALGAAAPFLYKLVPVLAQVMQKPYPELAKRRENIAEIILAEEKNFISILDSSATLFKEKFSGIIKNKDQHQAGKTAFQLYDTYGIPLELTVDWLSKQGIGLAKDAFEKELEEQKTRSKLLSSMKGDVFAVKDIDYGVKETKFLGYKEYSLKAKVLKIIKGQQEAKKINKGEQAVIILDKTPFYPEAGGQAADTGEFIKGKNIFEVLDTKKAGKAIIHIGRVKEGSFKKNDLLQAKINSERRLSIGRNHTSTHLLQAALRKVLGGHVQQQGSLVAEDKFRFDFTHFKGLDKEQLNRVEEEVNTYILENYELRTRQMPLSEAKKTGALAFFGEKYEGKVRVVSVGDFSSEFCGGTHLSSTGQIGLFKIIQEGSVASGVRRIEAATGSFAYKLAKKEEESLQEASALLNVNKDRFVEELQKRLVRIKALEKELQAKELDSAKNSLDSIIQNAQLVKGVKIIAATSKDMNSARKAVDLIKDKVKENAVIFSSTGNNLEGQILWAIGITEDLCAKGITTSEFILSISQELGGSGNGRNDFAQGGGKMPQNFNKVIQAISAILERSL